MLKMLFLLPFADFKSISVGGSPALVAAPDFAPELLLPVLAVLVAVGAILVNLNRRPKPRPRHDRRRAYRPSRPIIGSVPRNWVVVDGSNVMHWQDNTPRLAPILKVVNDLRARGFDPGVIFDANAGWKLFGKYINEHEFGRMLGLPTNQVLVVPKGTQADSYILATARQFNARIVTNDRYRDWTEAHPEVAQPGFLIRGEIAGDEVRLQGVDGAKAPVS